MGTFKEETGKTRVGAFLQNVAPEILDVAGNLTGIDALSNLGDVLKGNTTMDEETKAAALSLLQLDLEDRKSAREMQIAALQQEDVFTKRFNAYLTIGIFSGFFIIFVLLFFVNIPEGNGEIIYMAFGTFVGIVGTVAAFHYGSSVGSKDKSESITNLLKKK